MDFYHGIQNKQAERQRNTVLSLGGVEARMFPRYGNFPMGAAVILADSLAQGTALAEFAVREGLHAFVLPPSNGAEHLLAAGVALRERAEAMWIDPRRIVLIVSGGSALTALSAAQGEGAPFACTASRWVLPPDGEAPRLERPAFFACPVAQCAAAVSACKSLQRMDRPFELHLCADLADLEIPNPPARPSSWMAALSYWIKDT